MKSTNTGGLFGVLVAGVPVDTGKTSSVTSCVEVPLESDAKNLAVVVPKLVVAVGVHEKTPVDAAQVAPEGSSVANVSVSPSGSVALALNVISVPNVVVACVGPFQTGSAFAGQLFVCDCTWLISTAFSVVVDRLCS